MIRLLLRLFRIRDFEPCKSCETLIKVAEYERKRNEELTNILMNILQPKAIEVPDAPPMEIADIRRSSVLWGKRRAVLEERDRIAASTKKQSILLAKPDDKLREIEELEKEVGISEETEKESVQ